MRLFVCCNLLLLFFDQCYSYGLGRELRNLGENDSLNASKCLESLIEVTDWTSDNFLVIFDEAVAVDDDFLKRYTNFAWQVNPGENYNFTGVLNVIIFAKNFHKLDETLRSISIQRIDRRAKLVIRATEGFANLAEIRKAAQKSPAMMWKLDRTRVLYLVPCHENILAMTYFPFARNCQVGELEVLDTWNGTDFDKGAELFPETMLDLYGCTQNQRISTDNSSAFQLRTEFRETGEVMLGGVGGKLITIVAEKMNFKLRYKLCSDFRPLTSLFDEIVRGESLFSIARNIPTADRVDIFEEDIGYMQESLGFAYVARDFDVSWKNFVGPLTNEVWIYVGCIFSLFCGFILLLNRCYYRGITTDKLRILDVFAVFLGNSVILPPRCFGRYLLGMWIVYSYLINASYNSGLVSFLTTPREMRIIRTFEDLLNDGMDFGGSAFYKEFYNDPSDPLMMRIYNNFKIWDKVERNRIFYNRQGAISMQSLTVKTYNSNITGNFKHKIRMLEDKAFSFHSPIFMRRGSPFVSGVRRYTSRVIQSGIVDYWIKYYDRASGFKETRDTTPTVLSMLHLQGIFNLCIAGQIVSSIVFLAELFYHKYFSYHLN